MNGKIKFIVLSAILLGGGSLFLCPELSSSESEEALRVVLAPPRQALDLSDLDVRDNLNRPVQTASARRQIESLFFKSLSDLLLFNLTPGKRNNLILMAVRWNTLFG